MPHIEIIAGGLIRSGPYHELTQDFIKRLHWKFTLTEISPPQENQKILSKIKSEAYVIVLDERGKSLNSREFADLFEKADQTAKGRVQFVIGAADGVNDVIRSQADLILSFGLPTWPHRLARVMLLEQIYRAQQILNGHPYHRD